MTEYCECCGESRTVKWYLLDDNAEVTLCNNCVEDLKGIGEKVERIQT